MRLLVVGLSGIGSHFALGLAKLIRSHVKGTEHITEVVLCDFDRIEAKNLPYTAFDAFDIGRQKAEVLAEQTGFTPLARTIGSGKDLEQFDLAVLCVDNTKTRLIAYEREKPFIDLRAKGRAYACYTVKGKKARDAYWKTLRESENESCQYRHEIRNKSIQLGSRVAADAGLQLLLDYLRGESRRTTIVGTL